MTIRGIPSVHNNASMIVRTGPRGAACLALAAIPLAVNIVAEARHAAAPAIEGKPATPAAPAYVITPEQRAFWSLQPLRKPPVPAVSHASWAKTDIDRFVLARLEGDGLTPGRAADKRALIRRATLDL